MKNIKVAVICLAIASFTKIDASWSAFTPQCINEKVCAREFSRRFFENKSNEIEGKPQSPEASAYTDSRLRYLKDHNLPEKLNTVVRKYNLKEDQLRDEYPRMKPQEIKSFIEVNNEYTDAYVQESINKMRRSTYMTFLSCIPLSIGLVMLMNYGRPSK